MNSEKPKPLALPSVIPWPPPPPLYVSSSLSLGPQYKIQLQRYTTGAHVSERRGERRSDEVPVFKAHLVARVYYVDRLLLACWREGEG